MAKSKLKQCKGELGGVVDDAYSALDGLKGEMESWRDNMEEKLSHTSKYESVSECADNLSEADSAPQVPEILCTVEVEWTEDAKRNPSRATRRDNAVAALQACLESAQDWLDDSANKESPDRDEVEGFISELESAISNFESADFPGMFG